MSCYLTVDDLYYEGDRACVTDREVTPRPTAYHTYVRKLKQWTLDDAKVALLKRQMISLLDEQYATKKLLNLNENELRALEEVHAKKVKEITNSNDPMVIEKVTM